MSVGTRRGAVRSAGYGELLHATASSADHAVTPPRNPICYLAWRTNMVNLRLAKAQTRLVVQLIYAYGEPTVIGVGSGYDAASSG